MKRILFVCLGNICRSPAAEGVFRARAKEAGFDVYCDSAGTGAWHVGKAPDARMQATAKRRGIGLSQLSARQVDLADFYEFDYLVAMDLNNHHSLLAMAPANRECDIRLFLDFAGCSEREVPDPYYGGADGFEHVFDLIEDAARGFLEHLENEDDG
ncbi:low molecular weight protein-tyrosine-phosphatase [Parvularcula sp. IMCC14364]|uniref:low molecular weight protein-tyrosine-phosphatase n=1 Tax=Parvularcula sp. IMCC14364 TaxID=3067902 RepID=UPI0027410DEB|nr:low molecular weight protein-tyrosine-phosphatase [Parvularcula sp. IMCC14364]